MAKSADLNHLFKDACHPTQNSKAADGASFGKPASADLPPPTPSTDITEVQFADVKGVEGGVGGPGE
jgi:hypothetical protein